MPRRRVRLCRATWPKTVGQSCDHDVEGRCHGRLLQDPRSYPIALARCHQAVCSAQLCAITAREANRRRSQPAMCSGGSLDLFDQTDVRILSGRLWPLRLGESSMINRRTYQNAAALGIGGFALLLTMSDAFAF